MSAPEKFLKCKIGSDNIKCETYKITNTAHHK